MMDINDVDIEPIPIKQINCRPKVPRHLNVFNRLYPSELNDGSSSTLSKNAVKFAKRQQRQRRRPSLKDTSRLPELDDVGRVIDGDLERAAAKLQISLADDKSNKNYVENHIKAYRERARMRRARKEELRLAAEQEASRQRVDQLVTFSLELEKRKKRLKQEFRDEDEVDRAQQGENLSSSSTPAYRSKAPPALSIPLSSLTSDSNNIALSAPTSTSLGLEDNQQPNHNYRRRRSGARTYRRHQGSRHRSRRSSNPNIGLHHDDSDGVVPFTIRTSLHMGSQSARTSPLTSDNDADTPSSDSPFLSIQQGLSSIDVAQQIKHIKAYANRPPLSVVQQSPRSRRVLSSNVNSPNPTNSHTPRFLATTPKYNSSDNSNSNITPNSARRRRNQFQWADVATNNDTNLANEMQSPRPPRHRNMPKINMKTNQHNKSDGSDGFIAPLDRPFRGRRSKTNGDRPSSAAGTLSVPDPFVIPEPLTPRRKSRNSAHTPSHGAPSPRGTPSRTPRRRKNSLTSAVVLEKRERRQRIADNLKKENITNYQTDMLHQQKTMKNRSAHYRNKNNPSMSKADHKRMYQQKLREKVTAAQREYPVGVRVQAFGRIGSVMFVGSMSLGHGIWVSIKLDEAHSRSQPWIESSSSSLSAVAAHELEHVVTCEPQYAFIVPLDSIALLTKDISPISQWKHFVHAIIRIQRFIRRYQARKITAHHMKLAEEKKFKRRNSTNGRQRRSSKIEQQFGMVDALATDIRHYQVLKWKELQSYLTGTLVTDTTVKKVRAIFRWICYGIDLNVFPSSSPSSSSSSSSSSPKLKARSNKKKTLERILKTKKATAHEMAQLFTALCRGAGIRCYTINGFGKIGGTSEGIFLENNHSWNIVQLKQNSWALMDCAWSCGIWDNGQFAKRFSEAYFNTDPELFVLNHFPVEVERISSECKDAFPFEDSSKAQLLGQEYTFTKAEFEENTQVERAFIEFNLKMIEPRHAHTIKHHTPFYSMQLTAPNGLDIIAKLEGLTTATKTALRETAAAMTQVAYRNVTSKNRSARVRVVFPIRGCYQLILKGRRYHQNIHRLARFSIQTEAGVKELHVQSGSTYLGFVQRVLAEPKRAKFERQFGLNAPVNGLFEIGSTMPVSVTAPDCISRMVVSSNHQWSEMKCDVLPEERQRETGVEQFFTGSIIPMRPEINIFYENKSHKGTFHRLYHYPNPAGFSDGRVVMDSYGRCFHMRVHIEAISKGKAVRVLRLRSKDNIILRAEIREGWEVQRPCNDVSSISIDRIHRDSKNHVSKAKLTARCTVAGRYTMTVFGCERGSDQYRVLFTYYFRISPLHAPPSATSKLIVPIHSDNTNNTVDELIDTADTLDGKDQSRKQQAGNDKSIK